MPRAYLIPRSAECARFRQYPIWRREAKGKENGSRLLPASPGNHLPTHSSSVASGISSREDVPFPFPRVLRLRGQMVPMREAHAPAPQILTSALVHLLLLMVLVKRACLQYVDLNCLAGELNLKGCSFIFQISL